MFSLLSVVLGKVRLFPRHKEKIDRTKRRVAEPQLPFVRWSKWSAYPCPTMWQRNRPSRRFETKLWKHTHTHTPLLPILESSFVIIRDDVGGLIDNLQQERLHKNRNSAQSIEESYLARSSISHSIRSSIRPRSNRISLGIGEFHLHEKMLAVRNNSGGGMKEISFLPIRHPGGGSGSFYFHAWMMLAGTKIRGSPRHDKDEFNPRETIETLRKWLGRIKLWRERERERENSFDESFLFSPSSSFLQLSREYFSRSK